MSEYTINRTHGFSLRKFLADKNLLLLQETWTTSDHKRHTKKLLIDARSQEVLLEIICSKRHDVRVCKYRVTAELNKFQTKAVIRVLGYHGPIGVVVNKKNLLKLSGRKFKTGE